MTLHVVSPRVTALPVVAALALLLVGCGGSAPGTPAPGGSSSPGTATPGSTPGASDGETDDPAGSASEEPGATDAPASPVVDSCGLTSDDYANVRDALRTANTAAIEGYVGASVYVTYAATEYEGATSNAALVVANLGDVAYPGVTWTFDIPSSELAAWAASPSYAEDFTACALVGIQSDGRGVSLTFAGGRIVRENITYDVASWGY